MPVNIHTCIVIYSYSTTNKMHLLSQIIYSCKTLYMFWAAFLSIIRSSSCVYVACPENSRMYRIKIFQSYLEAIQPCRLQSTPLYYVCTAASVSSMF
jgi:hypothetical protein